MFFKKPISAGIPSIDRGLELLAIQIDNEIFALAKNMPGFAVRFRLLLTFFGKLCFSIRLELNAKLHSEAGFRSWIPGFGFGCYGPRLDGANVNDGGASPRWCVSLR